MARDLLGATLVRRAGGQTISGVISETEAYGQSDDPASHAYRNKTQRNQAMFGQVGRAYVYFTYGMHYCFNATARDADRSEAGAVLIRGIIPRKGVAAMMRNRKTQNARILADGPAKLTQAMCISSGQYGEDLTTRPRLCITGNPDYDGARHNIVESARIGIREATGKPWNFRLPA